ncbi:helix-turn-helix transcriptional regulator [Patulibacter sp. NPDC049589]|uniref:helix-turn-helix domain-containing protein n=1 Tax=Patulibacter sp. NPDC049589 TaxID=3154731 RepID=UPI00342AFC7C
MRAARIRAGLTQREVADRLQVPIDTYRRWDRETSQPRSPQRQRQLAAVLGVSLETLFPTDADPHVAVAMRMLDNAPADDHGIRKAADHGADGKPALAADSSAHPGTRADAPGGPSGAFENSGSAVGTEELTKIDVATAGPLVPLLDTDAHASDVDQMASEYGVRGDSVGAGRPVSGGPPAQATDELRRGDSALPRTTDVLGRVERPMGDGWRRIRPRRLAVPATTLHLRAMLGTAAVVLVVGLWILLATTAGDPAAPTSAPVPRGAAVSAGEAQARRIDVAEQRRDFDLVMSLASASGDRESYDGARKAAADLLLDRASDALKAGHVRTARRLVERVERRYGDPRPHRRASLTDRITAARKATRTAERRRETVAEQRQRANATAPQAGSTAASPPAVASSPTQAPAPSATTAPQAQEPSSSGGGSSSPSSRPSSDSDRSPEFF